MKQARAGLASGRLALPSHSFSSSFAVQVLMLLLAPLLTVMGVKVGWLLLEARLCSSSSGTACSASGSLSDEAG